MTPEAFITAPLPEWVVWLIGFLAGGFVAGPMGYWTRQLIEQRTVRIEIVRAHSQTGGDQ